MAEEQPKSISRLRENPCPICSGMTFIWGVTVGEKPTERLYTGPDGAVWGDSKEVITRECTNCGNVQLFTRVYTSNG